MLAENFAEQGGGRRKAGALQGRQRSYAEFYATDVKGFYLIIVSVIIWCKRKPSDMTNIAFGIFMRFLKKPIDKCQT